MNGNDFQIIVGESFTPFLEVLGFELEGFSISGRHYRARYTGSEHAVLISYEPGDEAFFIIIPTIEKGQLSEIDDRTRTPRLSDLNSRYMGMIKAEERSENEEFFKSVAANDDEEALLLKAAKELRLVLPKYLRRMS